MVAPVLLCFPPHGHCACGIHLAVSMCSRDVAVTEVLHSYFHSALCFNLSPEKFTLSNPPPHLQPQTCTPVDHIGAPSRFAITSSERLSVEALTSSFTRDHKLILKDFRQAALWRAGEARGQGA